MWVLAQVNILQLCYVLLAPSEIFLVEIIIPASITSRKVYSSGVQFSVALLTLQRDACCVLA